MATSSSPAAKPRAGGGYVPLLVRLNSDGSLDPSLAPPFADDFGDIDELLVLPDGRILIGGDFAFLPTGTNYNFACLQPDGSLDTAFMTNVGSGPNGWAGGELALQPDGTIFVGGIFKSWNGQPRASIARLQPRRHPRRRLRPAPIRQPTTPTSPTSTASPSNPMANSSPAAGSPASSTTAVETYNLTRFVNEYAPGLPGTIRLVATSVSIGENQPAPSPSRFPASAAHRRRLRRLRHPHRRLWRHRHVTASAISPPPPAPSPGPPAMAV